MKIKVLLMALAIMAFGSTYGKAQVAPYVMFSLSHYSGLGVGANTSNTQSGGMNALGATFGVNDDMFHAGPIAAGVDVRGMIQNSANSTPYGNKVAGFLLGPRITANTLVLPFRPYAQLEIGAVGSNDGKYTGKNTGFAYQVQFGGDFTIVPHVGARLEYGAGQVSGDHSVNHTLQTFGAGLVLRL